MRDAADPRDSADAATAGARRAVGPGAADVVRLGQLRMDSELLGDVHTIRLAGELDIATAKRVELELERVAATDARTIVVDLSALTFMDSCGLRAMLMADARLRDAPSRLAIRRGPPAVQRIFEISGLRDLLPWTD